MNALLAVVLILAQTTIVGPSKVVGPTTIPKASGGASLISEVSSGTQRAIQTDCSSPGNQAFPGNVTNGDDLVVGTVAYQNGSGPSHVTPSKTSGTSTIGAFVEDKNFTVNNASDFFVNISWWRAPVTGTGSLTLAYAVSGQTCTLEVIDEFVRSGGNMTVDGTPVSNTATSANESTGVLTTSTAGMCLMLSTEGATGDFTYSSRSDTNIGAISTGGSTFTGEAQFKITSGAGSPNLSISTGNSWIWGAIGVCYK